MMCVTKEREAQRKDLVPRRFASIAARRWGGDPLALNAQEGEDHA